MVDDAAEVSSESDSSESMATSGDGGAGRVVSSTSVTVGVDSDTGVVASETGGGEDSGVGGGEFGDRNDRLDEELIKPPSGGDTSLIIGLLENATQFYKGCSLGEIERVRNPSENLCGTLLTKLDNNAPVCLLY